MQYDPDKFIVQLESYMVGLVPSSMLHMPAEQQFAPEDLDVIPEPKCATTLDEVTVRWGLRSVVAHIRKWFADQGTTVAVQVWLNANDPLIGLITWSWVTPGFAIHKDSFQVDGRFWLTRTVSPTPPPGYKEITVTRGSYTARMWERVSEA